MAVPTITSISPVAGHTGGGTFVEIDGTNFAVPFIKPPVCGIVPAPAPSVSVTFGGVASADVRVVSDVLVYAKTPEHDPGSVDVVVTNLYDADGNAVSGETVTSAGAFAYQLPDLTVDSDLVRCIRTFIQKLKRQITPNVAWPVSTDYDTNTSDVTLTSVLPALPGLVIAEVELKENKFYSVRAPIDVRVDDESFFAIAPPLTVDIVMTLVGLSNKSTELVNLTAATKRFFRKNIYLEMARDPANPDAGSVRYEMDANDAPDAALAVASNNDNMRHFTLSVTVRGFDIEQISGLPLGGPAGESEGVVDFGETVESIELEQTLKRSID